MARKNKIYCRFEGCKHKDFTSRAGRLYHERAKHGRAFTDKDPLSDNEPNDRASPLETKTKDPQTKPVVKDQPRQDTFVKITDVKFKMAKTKREPKTDENGEYENECGKCGHEFNGVTKFCPECGCEFA